MNNQHEFAQECDIAIASKSIKQIQICIERLESKLSEQSDLTKCWKQYFLGNLYVTISAIEEVSMDDTSNNALSALNYYKNSYEFATKNNSPIKLEIQANLAKSLMKFGLYIEALPLFTIDFLTEGDSPFVSSINKAISLKSLLLYLNDEGHQRYYRFEIYKLLKNLQSNISKTTHQPVIETMHAEHTIQFLKKMDLKSTKGMLPIDKVLYTPRYNTQSEKKYREWCAENYLFLNNLNDITTLPIIAHDIVKSVELA